VSEEKKQVVALNLFQRINAIRDKVGYVQKDKSVSTGTSGSYKAVTHDMVTAITRGAMIEHGVICYPILVESVMNLPIIDTTGATANQRLYEATYDFVFINADQPEEKITIRIQAHAMDNADKAPGKALSYAKKYAILKLFEIETGEDEEGRVTDNSLDEEVLAAFITPLNNATNLDELRLAYETAYSSAEKAKDISAMKDIIRAKNARGKALTAGLAATSVKSAS
jgi:hypothetical protein